MHFSISEGPHAAEDFGYVEAGPGVIEYQGGAEWTGFRQYIVLSVLAVVLLDLFLSCESGSAALRAGERGIGVVSHGAETVGEKRKL